MILIVTIRDDLHALRVKNALNDKGFRGCHILECDHISSDLRLYWQIGKLGEKGRIFLQDNLEIDTGDIKLIWWRRFRADQVMKKNIINEFQVKLINNDCRGALSGVLEAGFSGKWISNPNATDRASNKIYQLSVAQDCGFRVPETLVSQSKQEVIEFANRFNDQVIVKPVVGAAGPLMFTEFIKDPGKYEEESYSICPAVYQEFIEGTKHVRLNCFGEKFYAATIETDELDWRPNLNVPIQVWEVPEELKIRTRDVLDRLGLEMGIVDIKMTPSGELVWFEVNPQGQFLFLEPLIKIPLADHFAEYLLDMMDR